MPHPEALSSGLCAQHKMCQALQPTCARGLQMLYKQSPVKDQMQQQISLLKWHYKRHNVLVCPQKVCWQHPNRHDCIIDPIWQVGQHRQHHASLSYKPCIRHVCRFVLLQSYYDEHLQTAMLTRLSPHLNKRRMQHWLSATTSFFFEILGLTFGVTRRERARQARANKLAQAVEQLDGDGDKENSADVAQLQRPLYSLLEPAEAALVEQLLEQVMSNPPCPPPKTRAPLPSFRPPTAHFSAVNLLLAWQGRRRFAQGAYGSAHVWHTVVLT